MADAAFRDFIPTRPETELDRAALALLDAIPPGPPATIRFGDIDCPSGAALVEPPGCCWDFGAGATSVIERLSLGRANAWRINWICEPTAGPADEGTRAGTPPGAELLPRSLRPWAVRHPDVEMTVFSIGNDVILQGATGAVAIKAGTPVGKISYSPNEKRAYEPGNRSYAVAHTFRGFELLFDCMDTAVLRDLPMPEYLLGDALQTRMALFLTYFDFDLIDNGALGATVFAPVEGVRMSLDRNRRRWQPLLARANR